LNLLVKNRPINLALEVTMVMPNSKLLKKSLLGEWAAVSVLTLPSKRRSFSKQLLGNMRITSELLDTKLLHGDSVARLDPKLLLKLS